MSLEGPQELGRYQLVSRIGKGGMAEIFMAKLVGALGFEKLLVIKRILPQFAADPSFVSMFVTEAKLVCQLVHPNIVQVFEFGEADGQYFIAMEHVEGIDGHRLWKSLALRRQRIPAQLGLYIVGEALKGLEHAHRAMGADGKLLGVVHRDVSPSNLLISYRGDVKIGDFGIALVRQESRSQAGLLKGKFGYMTPEQLAGLPVDHRSDVFSAGTVLAELLTGVRLFFGQSDFETMRNVIEVRIHALEEQASTLDPEVLTIVERALRRDPRDRYQSAGEFQEAIADYLFRNGHRLDNQALAAFVAEHVAPFLVSDEQAPATPASAAEISATAPPVDLERTERHAPVSVSWSDPGSDLLLEGSSVEGWDDTTSPSRRHDTAIETRPHPTRCASEEPPTIPTSLEASTLRELRPHRASEGGEQAQLPGEDADATPVPELIPLHEVTLGARPRTATPARPVSPFRQPVDPPPAPRAEATLPVEPEAVLLDAPEDEEDLPLEIDDRPLAVRLSGAPAPPPRRAAPEPPPARIAPPSMPASEQPAPAAELENLPPSSRADLQAITVTRVLSRLTRAGESGLLLLKGPALAGKQRETFERVARLQAELGAEQAKRLAETRTCALHLQRGVPDLVTADRSEETLVAYLLRSGVVRENQLELAIRNHLQMRPVAALIAAGLLAPLQVSRQVSSFVSWSLFEAFGWRQGQVSFYRGQPGPSGAFPTGQLGPELISKGVSYLPEPFLEHYFTPLLDAAVAAVMPQRQQPSQFANLPLVVEIYRETLSPGMSAAALISRGDKREQLRRRRALYLLLECELVALQ